MKSLKKPWISVWGFLKSLPKSLLILFVGAYRTIGTNHLGGVCRFTPSCSEYAVEAIKSHSVLSAIRLITKRILKCRPGGGMGYDPVPNTHTSSNSGVTHARAK